MTDKNTLFKIFELLTSISIVVIIPAFYILVSGESNISNWVAIFLVSLSIPWFYISSKPKKILKKISARILNLIQFLDKNGAFNPQDYKSSNLLRVASIILVAFFLILTNQFLSNSSNSFIGHPISDPLFYYISLFILFIYGGILTMIIHFSIGFMGSYNERKDHINYLIEVPNKPKSLCLFLLFLTEYWVLSVCCYAVGWKPNYAIAQWIYNKKQKRKKKVSQKKIDQLVKECLQKKTYKSSHNNQVYHFYQNNQEVNTAEIVKYLEEIQNIDYTTKTIRAKVAKTLNSFNVKT